MLHQYFRALADFSVRVKKYQQLASHMLSYRSFQSGGCMIGAKMSAFLRVSKAFMALIVKMERNLIGK